MDKVKRFFELKEEWKSAKADRRGEVDRELRELMDKMLDAEMSDRWCAGRLRPHEKRGFRDQEDTYGSRKTGISIALYFGIYHSQTLFRENLFVVLSTIERQQGAWQAGIIFKDGDRAIE